MADIELLKKNLDSMRWMRDDDAYRLASGTHEMIAILCQLPDDKGSPQIDEILIRNAEIRQRILERDELILHGTVELIHLEREERRSGYEG